MLHATAVRAVKKINVSKSETLDQQSLDETLANNNRAKLLLTEYVIGRSFGRDNRKDKQHENFRCVNCTSGRQSVKLQGLSTSLVNVFDEFDLRKKSPSIFVSVVSITSALQANSIFAFSLY